jgi:hypothetical protein
MALADVSPVSGRIRVARCRSCDESALERVLDLGLQPVADWLVEPGAPPESEARYPLVLSFCRRCSLLQLAAFAGEERVQGHAYSGALSSTVGKHDAAWAQEMVSRLGLSRASVVVDSGGGGKGVAHALDRLGVRTVAPTECRPHSADLVMANHSLAHALDLGRAVADLIVPLAEGGTIAVEFHHAARLLTETQFDLICHPHRTYLSVAAVVKAFARYGLVSVDADEIPVHGGSVRLYARRGSGAPGPTVERLMAAERSEGLGAPAYHRELAGRVEIVSTRVRSFLEQARSEGRTVLGYGAPSRASTLLNHCGVTAALLPATVDRSPSKQGRALPGCRVPIHAPGLLTDLKPDYVLILAWTLAEEIMKQLPEVRSWGGRFVTPLPDVKVLA